MRIEPDNNKSKASILLDKFREKNRKKCQWQNA